MPLLSARHVGSLIPDHFEAQTKSVHSRVVNLGITSAAGRGLLVSLVRNRSDMTALAIHVPEFRPREHTVDRVTRRGNYLQAVKESEWSVDLAGARAFRGLPLQGSVSEGAAKELRREILKRSREPGAAGFASLLDEPRNPFAARARGVLRAAGSGGPGSTAPENLAALVGLGIGFTPSGDDFVAGYLLASDATWSTEGAQVRSAVEPVIGKTTDGGRTLLLLALSGSYPCYLLDFWWRLRSAGAGPAEGNGSRQIDGAVSRALDVAVAHGETSGLDAATGIAWFLLTRGSSVL